jgi:hypothetical protein
MYIAEALVPIWVNNDSSTEPNNNDRPVLIVVETLGASLRGQMLNLTQTNARILPCDSFLMCSNVRVTVRFRSNDVIYALTGLTVAGDTDNSFGVSFDQITRQKMTAIYGGPKEPEKAPAPGPEPPRKRTKAEQRCVLHQDPPGGIDRRVCARHDMEVAATLVVVEKGIILKCVLLEVSLSGCRLFYENPIRLAQDTQVEVEFCGRGYPLRLGASVRLKSDEHLIGLEFYKASMRVKERLSELIAELEADQKSKNP